MQRIDIITYMSKDAQGICYESNCERDRAIIIIILIIIAILLFFVQLANISEDHSQGPRYPISQRETFRSAGGALVDRTAFTLPK